MSLCNKVGNSTRHTFNSWVVTNIYKNRKNKEKFLSRVLSSVLSSHAPFSLICQDFKCRYDDAVSQLSWLHMTQLCLLDAVHEAARKQAGSAVPLQCAFEPAVLPLPVHEHNVPLLEFQLSLALRRIRDHHPVPGEHSQRHSEGQKHTPSETTDPCRWRCTLCQH